MILQTTTKGSNMVKLSLNAQDLELLKLALSHAINDIEQQSINAYNSHDLNLFNKLAGVKRDTIAMQNRVYGLINVIGESYE